MPEASLTPSTRAARGVALPSLTRREGLLLFGALMAPLSLAACSEGPAAPAPASTTAATPAGGMGTDVAAEETALIALYDSALASLGGDDTRRRDLLVALREQHVNHRDALDPSAQVAATTESGDTTSPQSPGLRDLAEAERRAAKARIKACVQADDADLARTLAFIAASEASHVPALMGAL